MDNIQEKIMTINKVEKALTSTGKQLIKIKDNQNLSHQLWPIKQDGTESKAYQFFKTLPMDGIGMTVRVSYKEEQGDYNGKAVVYRTIIGMDNGQVVNRPLPPKNTATGANLAPQAIIQPARDVNWDKISRGKCKFGFLIEAYKLGKSLQEAEMESELWADASMRNLADSPLTPGQEGEINLSELPF